MSSKELIQQLQLQPHPEGGYYRETYRSAQTIGLDASKSRSVSTAIYFLLEDHQVSVFHRIQSDELWFFHQGEPLEIVFIHNDQLHIISLGNEVDAGSVPQAIIPANIWFASRVKSGKGFSLVSCTVAPGFDFEDFEIADRKYLLEKYPELSDAIIQFTN